MDLGKREAACLFVGSTRIKSMKFGLSNLDYEQLFNCELGMVLRNKKEKEKSGIFTPAVLSGKELD